MREAVRRCNSAEPLTVGGVVEFAGDALAIHGGDFQFRDCPQRRQVTIDQRARDIEHRLAAHPGEPRQQTAHHERRSAQGPPANFHACAHLSLSVDHRVRGSDRQGIDRSR